MGVSGFDGDDYCNRIDRILDFLGWYAKNAGMDGERAKLVIIESEVMYLADQTKQLKRHLKDVPHKERSLEKGVMNDGSISNNCTE